MSEHRFGCDYCLDRGWVIESGFSPNLESRAEFVPCPVCRPAKAEPRTWPAWPLLIAILAIFLMAFSSVCHATRSTTQGHARRRVANPHAGPAPAPRQAALSLHPGAGSVLPAGVEGLK